MASKTYTSSDTATCMDCGKPMYKDKDGLQKIIDSLFEYYFAVFPDAPRIPVQMTFTSDLNEAHAQIRPDFKDDPAFQDASGNEFNGRMVLPIFINDPIHILVNTRKAIEHEKAGQQTFQGTIAHEFTHAIDFYQMARRDRLESYFPLEKTGKYTFFQQWSEYHARKRGYYFLRKCCELKGIMPDEKTQIEHIITIEAPFQARRYKDVFPRITPNQRLYNTMQDVGRYSVWMDLFPDVFGRSHFMKVYGFDWMWDILIFLRDHETLESIYGHFDEFKEVLSRNWTFDF